MVSFSKKTSLAAEGGLAVIVGYFSKSGFSREMYRNAKPAEQVPPCNQVLLVDKVRAGLAMGALRINILFRENARLPEGMAELTVNSGAGNFIISG